MTLKLVGQRFGRLLVIERAGSYKGKAIWRCICDCETEIIVTSYLLSSGATKSCGCLRHDMMVATGRANRIHGQSRAIAGNPTRTFVSWQSMLQRCHYNKASNFARYGAVGIAVCDRWRSSFEAFLIDMGERPEGMTLDRIDGTRGYEPSNCRWATPKEQAKNRRKAA